MKDPNAGKYQKIYQEEFNLAFKILARYLDGTFQWGTNDYEAFIYREEGVTLLFYPHKTSAGNYHVRVRDQNSKNKERAKFLMELLYEKSGYNCTFSHKH